MSAMLAVLLIHIVAEISVPGIDDPVCTRLGIFPDDIESESLRNVEKCKYVKMKWMRDIYDIILSDLRCG